MSENPDNSVKKADSEAEKTADSTTQDTAQKVEQTVQANTSETITDHGHTVVKEEHIEKKTDQGTQTQEKVHLEKTDDDEEITIDFSKIKGKLFGDKKEAKPAVQTAEDKDDDEISIDFSKIKKAFASDKKEEAKKDDSDDDEVSIDFSKIKSAFKSKPENKPGVEATTSKPASQSDDDEEVSFDFSKVKGMFKAKPEEKKESADSEEEFSFDMAKAKIFFKKYGFLLLLLIPIFLSIDLRMMPAHLPITDQWAADSVINSIRGQIQGQVNAQYPNLPEANRAGIVDGELQRVLAEQQAQIDQQIIGTSNAFKAQLQDDNGDTYLLAIDPHFWMRHARNVVENGHPGDELRDGIPYDTFMFAPGGRPVPFDMFHAYFTAYFFNFLKIFNPSIELMGAAFLVPVLISLLAIIPMFFIIRRFIGNFGATVGSVIFAIHPALLTRTVGGFSDTDAYNVMFPLYITWMFLLALDAKSIKHTIMYSVIGGLLVGLYAFTWGGWWYIFDFVLVTTFLYLVYYAVIHRSELKHGFGKFIMQPAIKTAGIFATVFVTTSAIVVSMLVNFEFFLLAAYHPIGFANLKEVGIGTIWPNVYTTVAEQNAASLNSVVNQIGFGQLLFLFIALMGIAYTLYAHSKNKAWFAGGTAIWYGLAFMMFQGTSLNTFLVVITLPLLFLIGYAVYRNDAKIDIKYALFLILWFTATVFASTKGVRFVLLVVPAFAIGAGIAFGAFQKFATWFISKYLSINKTIVSVVVMLLLATILIAPFNSAEGTVRSEIPSFNDGWAQALGAIDRDADGPAVINSWWDFGHWFKFWGNNPVTFDGTSQNTPQAHFVGNVLRTDDEDLAIGILRMLDCSAGQRGSGAFVAMNEFTNDGVKSIDILYSVMPETRDDAYDILEEEFGTEGADEIIELTHCTPPDNYFITSEDMVGKSGVWAHFGAWDFERSFIYSTLNEPEYRNDLAARQLIMDRFGYSEDEAQSLVSEVRVIQNSRQANDWIAPWPAYAGTIGCGQVQNDQLSCSNGFTINMTSFEAVAPTTQGRVSPSKLAYATFDELKVVESNNTVFRLSNSRPIGFTLLNNSGNYQVIQSDADLAAAMFTRLFYMDGVGLKHFQKLSDVRTVFGGRIIVWKIDWEGNSLITNFPPEPVVEEVEEQEAVEAEVVEEESETVEEEVEEATAEQEVAEDNTSAAVVDSEDTAENSSESNSSNE